RRSGSRPLSGGIHLPSISSVAGSYGGSIGAIRGIMCFGNRSASESKAQGDDRYPYTRRTGPGLGDGPADHGAARFARPAVGAARDLGAPRGAAVVPAGPGALWSGQLVGAQRPLGRAAGRRDRRGDRRGLPTDRRGTRAARAVSPAGRVGAALGRARARREVVSAQ